MNCMRVNYIVPTSWVGREEHMDWLSKSRLSHKRECCLMPKFKLPPGAALYTTCLWEAPFFWIFCCTIDNIKGEGRWRARATKGRHRRIHYSYTQQVSRSAWKRSKITFCGSASSYLGASTYYGIKFLGFIDPSSLVSCHNLSALPPFSLWPSNWPTLPSNILLK